MLLVLSKLALQAVYLYLETIESSVDPLGLIIDPPRQIQLDLFVVVVESASQMLYLEEALVDERFALPTVHVLSDQRVAQKFKHLFDRDRNVVPCLILESYLKWVLLYIILHIILLVFFSLVIGRTCKALLGNRY